MATKVKLADDPKVQALVAKSIKAHVAAGMKALALPEGTTARAGAEIKRAVKAAFAPAA